MSSIKTYVNTDLAAKVAFEKESRKRLAKLVHSFNKTMHTMMVNGIPWEDLLKAADSHMMWTTMYAPIHPF